MNILGLKVDDITSAKLSRRLSASFDGNKKLTITKINTEFISRALVDDKYRKLLNDSDLSIVDGRGVLWVARFLLLPVVDNRLLRTIQVIFQMIYSGASIVLFPRFITYPLSEAMPGVEVFGQMIRLASDKGVGVYLFGSRQEVLDRTIKNLSRDNPKLRIVGSMNGYDFQNDKNIDPVAEINKTDAKLLIVALGSPKQEQWIKDNISKLKNIRVAVGEGGTLTRIANPKQKAPKTINRLGLEWLWRLLFNVSETSSRSRFQRFWRSVPVFIGRSVRWKIKNGQTKI